MVSNSTTGTLFILLIISALLVCRVACFPANIFCVRRGSAEKSDLLQAGDLTMELSTHRVVRGGKEISLSTREFALLESLMRHKGAILSRTQLENQVWDYGFEGGSNIVDVYIRYLRKKIDDPFEKKLIHTIRGTGYTLRDEP